MIEEKIKVELALRLSEIFPEIDNSELEKLIEITRPPKKELGDFSTNIAFKISKKLGRNPIELAEEIVKSLRSWDWSTEETKAVNGFVNIFLIKEPYFDIVRNILDQGEKYANLELLKGHKIQVEFISANPTGPLTLANGRGGYGGDALARVFTKCGANVQREYYINDGGNQVKILGDSILVAAGMLEKEDDFYRGEYIEKWTESHKDIVENYSDKSFELGEIAAKDLVSDYIKPSVGRMNINFDNWFSEKAMIERGEVDEVILKLKEYDLTKVEDGALWMETTKFGDDKDRVLVKADGEKTYFANDVAYHFDKLYKRKFDKVVNFWGADHHGYVGRMLAAVSAMSCPGHVKIVIMQLVRLIKDGQEFKMSKRKGTYVTMDDLFELIGDDAADVTRWFFLSRSFNTHMDFDLDLAKERSDKNPVFYVKYAYARMSSILRKGNELDLPKVDITKLDSPEEIELIDQISQLENVVRSIVSFDDYPVHNLTYYALDTARMFHSFYDKCRVIDESDLETTSARLKLVEATRTVLGIVMKDLIGIDAPEKM
jgi:arginyl-tRNA synthetase